MNISKNIILREMLIFNVWNYLWLDFMYSLIHTQTFVSILLCNTQDTKMKRYSPFALGPLKIRNKEWPQMIIMWCSMGWSTKEVETEAMGFWKKRFTFSWKGGLSWRQMWRYMVKKRTGKIHGQGCIWVRCL